MVERLLQIIGVTGEVLERLDEATLAFQHPRVLWIGLAALVPLAYFIYRRQERNLTSVHWGLRLLLTSIRVFILAILVLVLAVPYLKIDEQIEKKALVAVLFDHSGSMHLPAGPFESEEELARMAQAAGYSLTDGEATAEIRKALNQTSRIELAQAVVSKAAEKLTVLLAKDYDMRYFSFAESVAPVMTDHARPEFPEPPKPGGSATRMGDALAAVLDEAAGQPIAGIVLLSDGQHTGGRPPMELAEAAGKARVPIFTVPPGSSTRLRDVSIVDVFTCGLVSAGDTAKVSATLESFGFDGQSVEVQLLDGEEVLDHKTATLRGGEHQQVDLSFKTSKPGARHLKVHVPPPAEEPEELHINNTDVAVVRVNEERLKVLFVDGRPRWDFRFLKNSLRRDEGLGGRTSNVPEIVLETEARRRAPDQAPVLPATIEEVAEYALVVLGDASPKLLDEDFLVLLDEAVRKRGVGLIVAAGPAFMPHAYGPVLQDLLPVEMRADAAGMLAPSRKPFLLELSPEGTGHEVMRLYEDTGRNQTVWAVMPPYYWCAAAERPAAAATVLAWNPDLEVRYGRVPLIAYHFAGEGRVLFVGLDSTWHWRQNVGERFFYKFWGQAIRFIARGGDKGAASSGALLRRSWLEAQPIRLEPGKPVEIEAAAYDGEGNPRVEPLLSVNIEGPGAPQAVALRSDPDKQGHYIGSHSPEQEGHYRVNWRPGGMDEVLEASFDVLRASEELRRPNIDRLLLQQIAAASGGELLALSDLSAIPDRLEGETKLTKVHHEATVWDNWLVLLVLILAYSLDVGLRRLKGLA